MKRLYLLAIVGLALFGGCEGPAGETGATGDAGPQGEQGPEGPQGPRGEKGEKGDDGETGDRGPEGPAGDDGDPGPRGPPGGGGPEGPAGPQGDPGSDGSDGEDGADGRGGLFTDEALQIEILSATVDATQHPVLDFTVTDGAGRPLDVEGLYTAGTIDLAYTLAAHGGPDLASLITRQAAAGDVVVQQATSENNGTLEPIAEGAYRYTYATALPDDFDPDTLIRTVIGGRRTFADGTRTGRSASVDFAPSGAEPAMVPAIAGQTDNCNKCHQGLEGHGGRWTSVDACVTCHTPQTTDPESGNTVDFKVMIHRIHMGANLPSVQAGEPYQIIGFRGAVHDFSGVHLPRPPSDCQTCHGDDAATWPDARVDSCLSCHDRTSIEARVPAGFERHTAGERPRDSCAGCHPATGTPSALYEVHRPALADPILDQVGLQFSIEAVEGAAPGAQPTIRFRVVDGENRGLALNVLDSLEITIAGPTSGFAWNLTMRNVQNAAAGAGGGYQVQFDRPIPADATGSIAVGMAGYRYVPYGAARADAIGRENGGNPVTYVNLAGGAPAAPKTPTDVNLCNNCHGDLAAHGTFRVELPYCQTCHNLNGTDAGQRPVDAGDPASISFGPMIHRIHAGAELETPNVIYGFGGAPIDFGEVEFPGDLANCQGCHQADWQTPTTRICTSCHDSEAARGHAALETAPGGAETCSVCHGPGREFAVH